MVLNDRRYSTYYQRVTEWLNVDTLRSSPSSHVVDNSFPVKRIGNKASYIELV